MTRINIYNSGSVYVCCVLYWLEENVNDTTTGQWSDPPEGPSMGKEPLQAVNFRHQEHGTVLELKLCCEKKNTSLVVDYFFLRNKKQAKTNNQKNEEAWTIVPFSTMENQ